MLLGAPCAGSADEISLVSLGVRARFDNRRVLGVVQPETFREYDAMATFALPWEWYGASGWGVGTRLLASAGALRGARRTALVASLLPALAFGDRMGRFVLDVGLGAAALSKHHFGRQDFGGPLQFALTAGLRVPLYDRFSVGYRFLHYSDAALYGSDTIGADFHMAEITYRF